MADPSSYRPKPGQIPDSPGVYRFRDDHRRVMAVLAWLGDRIEKGRIPFTRRLRRPAGESRFWSAVMISVPIPG